MGISQRHAYWLHKIIDDILNDNKQIKGIIEIGTGAGSLSIFLGAECYERRYKPLLTYDIKKYKKPRLFDLLKVKYIVRDCFNEKSINEIKEYITDIPIFLMCDGGIKIKEFNYFTGLLKQGSIIAAHDWGDEIKLEDILGTVYKYSLEPLLENEWNRPPNYIKTCFWEKTI
jgi:hypothetical protein